MGYDQSEETCPKMNVLGGVFICLLLFGTFFFFSVTPWAKKSLLLGKKKKS